MRGISHLDANQGAVFWRGVGRRRHKTQLAFSWIRQAHHDPEPIEGSPPQQTGVLEVDLQ